MVLKTLQRYSKDIKKFNSIVEKAQHLPCAFFGQYSYNEKLLKEILMSCLILINCS